MLNRTVALEALLDTATATASARDADLRDADLRGADLTGADLRGADLRGADLRGADLTGADLTGADLRGADLTGARLREVNLRGADLTGANLRGADLRGADLSGARLREVNLIGADLSGAYLSDAVYGDAPIVPDLDRQVADAVGDGEHLDMSDWHHPCGTSHCRAGWAIHLAGDEGYALEARLGPSAAGALIYARSTGHVPDFYATNEAALADILARGGVA